MIFKNFSTLSSLCQVKKRFLYKVHKFRAYFLQGEITSPAKSPHYPTKEKNIMEEYRNGCCGTDSCSIANKAIGCTVTQCAHHCKNENYCSLSKIEVVTHEANPTVIQCTDCSSFKLKD